MVMVHQPRMKVFALGLDENQKAAAAADEKQAAALETKIPIDSPIPPSSQQVTPAIVLAKRPRAVAGFGCGLLSWFVGAFCLVLLCLAISEVAYHRQRDQAFLRLKWAELRQRMLGYELLSQQQEIDRLSMEKQQQPAQVQIDTLPLRRFSKDPIKPQIVNVIQPENDSSKNEDDQQKSSETSYSIDQNGKLGFLRELMDKIRKHAESMGLSGDMQVHVVEVKPLGLEEESAKKETSSEENVPFDQSIADGFGEYAAPHQEFSDDGDSDFDGRRTFDRHSMLKRPFFGPFNRWEFNDYEDQQQQQQPRVFDGIPSRIFFQTQPEFFQPPPPPPLPNQFFFQQPFFWQQQQQQPQSQHYWWPQQQQQQQPEVQTNQWNWSPFQQQQQIRPWYMPEQQQQPQPQQHQVQPAWFGPQNDDWMMQKHQESPFQPNPVASSFRQQQQTWVDQTAHPASDFPPKSTVISADNSAPQQEMKLEKAWIQPHDDTPSEIVTSPDADLEQIDENKFLPIRSDDKPIDEMLDDNSPPSSDAHLFQIDDPSSFKR